MRIATMNVIFRQLYDPKSSTSTYLLADSTTHEAVLIDAVFEHARRDSALLWASTASRRLLERTGFTKAANLAGGMLEWCDHGLPIDTRVP
jgi:glyoxylase-like metal-dependent hydrolase (beta-lactamase superfamily II)